MRTEMRTVVYDEITCYLRPLHEMLMSGISDWGKEENLLFLISALIQKWAAIGKLLAIYPKPL